jgi:hypothetical protein
VQAGGFKRDLNGRKEAAGRSRLPRPADPLIANKRYEALYSAAVLVQAMASEAGINVELEVLDWATQLDRYTKGQYQSMAFIYSARIDPSLNYEMVSGDKAAQPRKVWDSPYAQTRLAESMVSRDKARRQVLFDEMHKQMLQDVPMIVLFNASDATAMRKSVTGFKGWAPGQAAVLERAARRALLTEASASMLAYLLRRIAMTIPTLLLVSIAVFTLMRLIPGDPVQLMLGEGADPAQLELMRHQMGLDQPLPGTVLSCGCAMRWRATWACRPPTACRCCR